LHIIKNLIHSEEHVVIRAGQTITFPNIINCFCLEDEPRFYVTHIFRFPRNTLTNSYLPRSKNKQNQMRPIYTTIYRMCSVLDITTIFHKLTFEIITIDISLVEMS